MSSIRFACDCGKAYKVPDSFAGKKVKCKQCGEPIRVPSESTREGPASGHTQRLDARAIQREESERVAKRLTDAVPRKKKRAGSKTEAFEVPELSAGERNIYKKKDEEELPRGSGRLALFEDEKLKKVVKLGKEAVTVGRADGCDLEIAHDSVSGEHLKVEYKLGHFIVSDLDSTNGVVVNGRKVRRASLKDGDILQVGAAILRIDC